MSLRINGQQIEDGVIEAEFAQIKAHFERLGNVSCCERDPKFRGYAKENITARVLLSQEAARRLGRLAAEEVDAAFRELADRYGGEAGFLAGLGAGPDQLELVRNDVEAELRVRKMLDSLVDSDPAPGDEELRQFHATHAEQFMTDEEVRASHILKSPRRGEDRHRAFEELRSVRRRLLNGEDFDELARVYSDKASDHIDLNFFRRGELPEELESVAFSMNTGEVSPIFVSAYGYHLLKATERKAARLRDFDEAREQVRERLLEERRQQATRSLVEQLQRVASIEELSSP